MQGPPIEPMLGAGVSLKPQHYAAALDCRASGMWLEVHAENYMVDGGPRIDWLRALRQHHPLSLHGVGLSLAADAAPDAAHLARLRRLVEMVDPALVSEHLAWSMWRGVYYADLLPVPRTNEALARVTDNVMRTQDALRRPIAVENPAHYLRWPQSDWGEIEFLAEIVRRTGCGLLLDVNNVYVSARNLKTSAEHYIDDFPAGAIREIHVAGHCNDPNLGEALLIDSHDASVAAPVWSLLERAVRRIGPRPTLLERDGNVPAFEDLMAERARAQRILETCAARGAREVYA